MRTQIQGDSRWKNEKLDHSNETIGKSGCFVTSLANMSDRTPSEVNKILTDNGLINSDGMLTDKIRIAQVLGLEYHGTSSVQPKYPCIAETAHFASRGVPQHFYIINPDGSQIDPLGYSIEYKVKSYRLFKKGDQVDEREIAKQIFCHTLNGYFASIYGRGFADPIAQFSKDFDYWYNTHKLECAGQWVNQQVNEPEFKEKWCKRSECITSDDKYVTAITEIKKITDKF